jgi:hypothetical protein
MTEHHLGPAPHTQTRASKRDEARLNTEYLRAHGITPRKAPIRSSSYLTFCDDPFLFMLKERVGIMVRNRTPPPALLLGGLAHTCWEATTRGLVGPEWESAIQAGYEKFVDQIEDDLARQEQAPLSPEEHKAFRDALVIARVWVAASWEKASIDFERWEPVLVEEEITLRGKHSPFTSEMKIKLDGLLLDKKKNEIWILDYKTTSYPTGLYVESTRYAVQPVMYRIVVDLLLQDEAWRDTLGLGGAKFVGFVHYVIAKPGIRISKKTTAKEGEEAAMQEYLGRCRDFYHGKGEFEQKAQEWGEYNAPLKVSFHRFRMKDVVTEAEWLQLRQFDLACACALTCENFPPRPHTLLPKFPGANARLSPYAPFYECATDEGLRTEWRGIMDENNFVHGFREDSDDGGILL